MITTRLYFRLTGLLLLLRLSLRRTGWAGQLANPSSKYLSSSYRQLKESNLNHPNYLRQVAVVFGKSYRKPHSWRITNLTRNSWSASSMTSQVNSLPTTLQTAKIRYFHCPRSNRHPNSIPRAKALGSMLVSMTHWSLVTGGHCQSSLGVEAHQASCAPTPTYCKKVLGRLSGWVRGWSVNFRHQILALLSQSLDLRIGISLFGWACRLMGLR